MAIADLIDTVVIVMMENRSFDHVLGHLSYDKLNPGVEGLTSPLNQQRYSNLFEAGLYNPWKKNKDYPLAFDLPHEFDAVATQLGTVGNNGYPMRGFVKAQLLAQRDAAMQNGMTAEDAKAKIVPGPRPESMGFFDDYQVPMTSFLAMNFAVCHHWFAPLPTSTQPNRTVAMCGSTQIADTKGRLIPTDDSVLDWLDRTGVRWRVYHDGLSFFALYPSLWNHVLGDNFRAFETLARDFVDEADATFPRVMIVEPSYASAPHIGSDRPNDNHPPVPMGFGEDFVRNVYDALIANPKRWSRTVMILTYDEHGGFYDHVSPPAIPYTVRDNTGAVVRQFDSLGVRVPTIVVSPLVDVGQVIDATFDHTSILQLLAELFTPGTPYSPAVAQRANQSIKIASAAITRSGPRTDIPKPPVAAFPATSDLVTRTGPHDTMQAAFQNAARELLSQRRLEVANKYPDLIHWQAVVGDAPVQPG